MSFLDTPWLNDQAATAPEGDTSAFSKGLRSGLFGAGSQLNAFLGSGAEALGLSDFAAGRYKASREYADQAAASAPPVHSMRDVHDLRSGYDYVTGTLGQAIPSVGLALGGAALMRRAPLMGAAAATTPLEAGDIVMRQQNDPVSAAAPAGQRFASAASGGATSALGQSYLPSVVAGQVLGRTAARAAAGGAGDSLRRAGGAMAVDVGAGAGGEAVKQASLRDTNVAHDFDPTAILDAGLNNLVPSAVMAGGGYAAERVHAKLHEAGTSAGDLARRGIAKTKEVASDVASRAQDAVETVKEKTAEVKDRSQHLFDKNDDHIARAVAEDDLIDPKPEGGDPAQHVAADDAKATEWASAKLRELLDGSSLSPEMKAKAEDLLSRVSDPAARAEVAAMYLARKGAAKARAFRDHMEASGATDAVKDAAGKVMDSVKAAASSDTASKVKDAAGKVVDGVKNAAKKAGEFKEGFTKEFKAATEGDVKKSADESGLRAALAQDVEPALSQTKPELKGDAAAHADVVEAVKVVVKHAMEGKKPHLDERIVSFLQDHFGDKASDVLDSAFNKMTNGSKEQRDNFYTALHGLDQMYAAHDSMQNIVKKYLKNNSINPRDAVEVLRRYTRGEHMKSLEGPERTYREAKFRKEIEQVFGKDTDKVLEAFNKEFEASQEAMGGKKKLDKGEQERTEDGDMEHQVGDELPETQIEREPPRIYRGKGKAGVLSLEAHRRDFGDTPSQHDRLMERALKDNPDRNVSFIKAKDFERDYGEKLNIPEGADPNDYGVIAAEGSRQEGRITEEEARAMRFDEGRGAHSKSRVKLEDGTLLDAYKITQNTLRSLPYIEGEVPTRRIARAFNEGLGSAMLHFDSRVADLPDSTVLAVRDGRSITLKDIKEFKDTSKTRFSIDARNDLYSELQDKRVMLGRAKTEEARQKILGEIESIENRIRGRESDPGSQYTKASYDEQGHETKSRVTMRGSSKKVDPADLMAEKGVYEIDPEGNIHEVALAHEKRLGSEDDYRVLDTGKMERKPKVDDRAPSTMHKADEPAKPAAESEHAPARKPDVTDDAKDIVAGGDLADKLLDRYINGVKAVEGGQAILEGGKTADYNVGTSYKSNKVGGEPPSPAKMRSLIEAINNTKLKNRRERLNANDAIEKLNAALGKALKKSPDLAYGMQLERRPSLEGIDTSKTGPSDAIRKAVEKYVKDVLGGRVKVEWAKLMHAGELDARGQELVMRLSVHALDPMGTAYHESLHGFFKYLRDQGNRDVMDVLVRASSTPHVMKQMREFFKDQPEVLKQLETDAEERVAYMYQLHAKDKLTLGPETKGVFQKIKDFVARVMGIWTNDVRAEHIMNYFHEGTFKDHIGDANAVSKALMEPGSNKYVESVKRALAPLRNIERAVLASGVERLRDTQVPALMRLGDLISPDKTDAGADVGFIQASKSEHASRMNTLARALKGTSMETLEAAHQALIEGKKGDTPEVEAARAAIRKHLDDMFDYMRSAGVNVRDLGYKADYFPRIWDPDFISRNQEAFKTMLEKYVASGKFKGNPEQVLRTIMGTDGTNMNVVVDMPGMQNTKARILDFISAEDAAPFVRKNLFQVLNSYTAQAARRAEWARRFNDDGSGMRQLLADAKKQGALAEEVDMAQDFIRAVNGTLGDDINPTMRRLIGNMIVYQNVRLLPLALFSMAVDPMGIVVRGGTMGDAFSAFKRGIMEIPRGFKKDKAKDSWYELAETMGIIDDTALMHAVGSSYTQGMVSETARKINDKLFQFNGVEQMTTSLRVSATQAAVKFIMKHGDGTYSKHSTRFMDELGLKPSDVIIKDGGLVVTEKGFLDHGYTPEQAAAAANKMKGALNKWVDGAILRPNAAEKPIWMNDPHWALVAHLKQFVYAFQHTILDRVWNETAHGNYAPAAALGSYVPIMLAADLVKGLIQGGGEQPEWKRNWGWQQYMASAVERAGLYGVGQFTTDFIRDVRHGGSGITAVAGPTVEQLAEALKVAGGREQFGTFFMRAMPANALYATYFNQPATDPVFAD